MDYDLENLKFKINEQEDSVRNRVSRSQVKGILERYRREAHNNDDEITNLKQKLSEAYDKLSAQIEYNNQNTEQIDQLQSELQTERKQFNKVKQVLQSVIENRKHLQRQLAHSKQQHRNCQYLHEQMKEELNNAKSELEQKSKQLSRVSEDLKNLQLTFENRVKGIKAENNRFENEKIRLERVIIEKDAEIMKLREENRKPKIQKENVIENVQNDIGKWKKQERRRQYEREAILVQEESSRSIVSVGTISQSSVMTAQDLDECLSIQQKRKQQIEHELNKLSNIKKLTPMERKTMQELQSSLYDVNSQIAGLKRRIRHRY